MATFGGQCLGSHMDSKSPVETFHLSWAHQGPLRGVQKSLIDLGGHNVPIPIPSQVYVEVEVEVTEKHRPFSGTTFGADCQVRSLVRTLFALD